MIAPDFVTRGVAAPADDTLAVLFDRMAERGYEVRVRRVNGVWNVCLGWTEGRWLPTYAFNARLDIALLDALAKLPPPAKEAPHA